MYLQATLRNSQIDRSMLIHSCLQIYNYRKTKRPLQGTLAKAYHGLEANHSEIIDTSQNEGCNGTQTLVNIQAGRFHEKEFV